MQYYVTQENNILLAYDKDSDFLALFNYRLKKWKLSEHSFIQIRHDFCLNEIKKEEVLRLTNNLLPSELYDYFVETIKNNKNI